MLTSHFGALAFANVTAPSMLFGVVSALIMGLQEIGECWKMGNFGAIHTSRPLGHWLAEIDENVMSSGGDGHLEYFKIVLGHNFMKPT